MNVLIPHIEAPVTHNRNDDFKLAQCHVCIDKLYNRHLGCLGKPGVLNCGIPVVTCIVYVTGIKFVYGCIWYMKILSTDVCACMCNICTSLLAIKVFIGKLLAMGWEHR